jgi:hypothetical protein
MGVVVVLGSITAAAVMAKTTLQASDPVAALSAAL